MRERAGESDLEKERRANMKLRPRNEASWAYFQSRSSFLALQFPSLSSLLSFFLYGRIFMSVLAPLLPPPTLHMSQCGFGGVFSERVR
jgi:hypothetical protein